MDFNFNITIFEATKSLIDCQNTRKVISDEEILDANKNEKLRVLMICEGGRMFDTHYRLHRKLAQLLASDAENVEKVVLDLETFVSQFKICGSSQIICCHRNSKQNIIDICNLSCSLYCFE